MFSIWLIQLNLLFRRAVLIILTKFVQHMNSSKLELDVLVYGGMASSDYWSEATLTQLL